MQAIYNRSKKINAIGKSKLDWKGFVRQEGIEDRLQYNRKGGVLKNLEFMNKWGWGTKRVKEEKSMER